MKQLFETIKINAGQAYHLAYHNQRLNDTRRVLFNVNNVIDLNNILQPLPQTGFYRCRVVYRETIEKIEYIPYTSRQFQHIKLIEANTLDYAFKYADRTALQDLVAQKGQADDILIIKNGFITDTSIANVAFYDGQQWVTPTTFLLKGTTRTRLLAENKIIAAEIKPTDLKYFTKMALMNALLDFYVLDVKNIVTPCLTFK